MNRTWLRFLLPGLLVVGALAYFVRGRPHGDGGSNGIDAGPPPAPSSVASAAVAGPLLEGLAKGSTIGEWTVDEIVFEPAPNKSPQIAINFMRKGSGLTVWIGRIEVAPMPPITTKKYGIAYGHPRPFGDPIPQGAAEMLGNDIAERVRRTEDTAPLPPGL